MPQLALYASALEAAVGQPPVTGLMFLRTSDVYVPPSEDLSGSLAAIRVRIDGGAILDTPIPTMFSGDHPHDLAT